MDPLELLSKEYEAEESQTLTTYTQHNKQVLSGDYLSHDDEETVIRNNNDNYVERLIQDHSKVHSQTNNTTSKVPPLEIISGINQSTTTLNKQPSQDFFAVVEHLTQELNNKNKEIKKQTDQLNKARNRNEQFQHQISSLSMNDKNNVKEIEQLKERVSDQKFMIQKLVKDGEEYEKVTKWLQDQMKNEQCDYHDIGANLSIDLLTKWKEKVIENLKQKYETETDEKIQDTQINKTEQNQQIDHDEGQNDDDDDDDKEIEDDDDDDDNVNEETTLLNKTNKKSKKKDKKKTKDKKKKKKKDKSDKKQKEKVARNNEEIEDRINSQDNNVACCAWFSL